MHKAAFGAKLSVVIPNINSRIAVLKEGFSPVFSFVAVRNGEIVTIVGFKMAQESLAGEISFRVLKDEIGYWGTKKDRRLNNHPDFSAGQPHLGFASPLYYCKRQSMPAEAYPQEVVMKERE